MGPQRKPDWKLPVNTEEDVDCFVWEIDDRIQARKSQPIITDYGLGRSSVFRSVGIGLFLLHWYVAMVYFYEIASLRHVSFFFYCKIDLACNKEQGWQALIKLVA